MYYNEIRQPDGTPIIGINYEEERPPVVDVLHTNETQQVQQQEPEYQLFQLFDSQMITWFTLFLVLASIQYTLMYDNAITILNCLACLLPLHSIQNNSMYGILAYTIYVMIAMLLTTFLGFYEYIWYYVICNGIIMCIFITSVVKYIKYIRNQHQIRNQNEHVV